MYKTSSVRLFRAYSAAVLACRTDPNDRFTQSSSQVKAIIAKYIKMGSCVFQFDVPHQRIAQRQVGPVPVYGYHTIF